MPYIQEPDPIPILVPGDKTYEVRNWLDWTPSDWAESIISDVEKGRYDAWLLGISNAVNLRIKVTGKLKGMFPSVPLVSNALSIRNLDKCVLDSTDYTFSRYAVGILSGKKFTHASGVPLVVQVRRVNRKTVQVYVLNSEHPNPAWSSYVSFLVAREYFSANFQPVTVKTLDSAKLPEDSQGIVIDWEAEMTALEELKRQHKTEPDVTFENSLHRSPPILIPTPVVTNTPKKSNLPRRQVKG